MAECVDGDAAVVLDCSSGEASNGVASDKQYTKLGSTLDIQSFAWNALSWMWALLVKSI